jgi:uncharacterized protein (TIGR03435 family)
MEDTERGRKHAFPSVRRDTGATFVNLIARLGCTMRIFALIISAMCLSSAVSGQTDESVGRFDVADVDSSPNSPNRRLYDLIGGLMSGGLMRGDFYSLKDATMLDLIRTAYRIDPQRVIGGPAWLHVNLFDVRARVPTGTTAATVNPMLQALLADRFGLVIRNDKRPVPGWALTASKRPQLKQSDGSGNSGCRAEDQAGAEQSQQAAQLLTIECHNITMADFAVHLNVMKEAWNYIGDKPVADQTALEGAWDFSFTYTRRIGISGAGAEAVNLSDGLEKIGLKLDPATVLVPVMVVAKVNQTPTPNSTEASAAFSASANGVRGRGSKDDQSQFSWPECFPDPTWWRDQGQRRNAEIPHRKCLGA